VIDRNTRNAVWFWVFLIALLVTGFYGIRAVSTAEACDDLPKTWSWREATWECPGRRY
jgi:hypothetical protein